MISNLNEINISHLDSGIYFVEVTQKNKNKSTHKIITI